VKSTDVLAILQEFYRERLTMRERHVAVARHVSNYEFNNTYQYIIAREDTQLSWLEAAIREMDGTADVVPPLTLAAPGRREGFLGLVDGVSFETDQDRELLHLTLIDDIAGSPSG